MTTPPDLSVIKAAAGARTDLIERARKLADTGTELHDRKGSVIGYDIHWGDASDALVDLADALSTTEALIARVEAAEGERDEALKAEAAIWRNHDARASSPAAESLFKKVGNLAVKYVDELEESKAENARLNDRNAEVSMLAHNWMVAHDSLAAGKPYSYPAPADLPNALQAAEARVEKALAVLEGLEWSAEDDWRNPCCPSCGEKRSSGHSVVCSIRESLTPTGKPDE